MPKKYVTQTKKGFIPPPQAAKSAVQSAFKADREFEMKSMPAEALPPREGAPKITNVLLVFQRKHEREGPGDEKQFDTTHTEDLETVIPLGTGRSTEILKRTIFRGVRELAQEDDEVVYVKARYEKEQWNNRKGRIDTIEIFRTVMPRKQIEVFIRGL